MIEMTQDQRHSAALPYRRRRAQKAEGSLYRSAQARLLLRQFVADLAKDMGCQIRCRHSVVGPARARASGREDDDFMPLPW